MRYVHSPASPIASPASSGPIEGLDVGASGALEVDRELRPGAGGAEWARGVPLDCPVEPEQRAYKRLAARDVLGVTGEVPIPFGALEEEVSLSEVFGGEASVPSGGVIPGF